MIDEKKLIEDLDNAKRHCEHLYGILFLDGVMSIVDEQPRMSQWIPVSERLPENEKRVLICANKHLCDGTVIQVRTIAMYEDGTLSTSDSSYGWEDCDFEYCEETDDCIIPEGWYEQNMYCEEFGIIGDFVTHWQPLPEPYKEVSE